MEHNPSEKNELNTEFVLNQLKGDHFPNSDCDNFLDSDIRTFFDEIFLEKGAGRSEIIRNAGISRTYGYQIMDGTRIGKRDYYLSIAIALELDLKTTQRLLAVTKSGGLHALIKRDAAIIFAINHHYDNDKIYSFLIELGLEPLDTGIK